MHFICRAILVFLQHYFHCHNIIRFSSDGLILLCNSAAVIQSKFISTSICNDFGYKEIEKRKSDDR